jgi:hypothetical protein
MLTRLTRGFRLRAASVLVALYAVCVLAPAAAFAFGDGSGAAHCLTDENHGLGKPHVHQDGTAHKHSDDADDQKSPAGKCCGLVCLSALAPADDLTLNQPIRFATVLSLVEDGIPGRVPDRLYRPPISLLSL